MEQTWILCCEDSIESIFTAIYDAWASKHGHNNIKIEVKGLSSCSDLELFANYINVETDDEKAEKVISSIPKKISPQAFDMVMKAAITDCEDKADVIYHFLVRGFAIGAKVIDYLTDDYVMKLFQMNRNVGNEVHLYKGFLRFEELLHGIMMARFEPKNDIAAILAPHFSDRFPNGNYMILDIKRRHAAVCASGNQFVMISLTEEQMNHLLEISSEEEEIKQCWKTFFKSVTINERINYKLQRNNIPIHYRKYMLEFK